MRSHTYRLLSTAFSIVFTSFLHLSEASSSKVERNNNPLNIDWDPAPPPEEGPALSAGALRDPAYLPAEIGGILGSYALSLVVVATLLLVLSRRRREHLRNGDNEAEIEKKFQQPQPIQSPVYPPYPTYQPGQSSVASPKSLRSPVRNFSYPGSPGHPPENGTLYSIPSPPISQVKLPGVDFNVDQRVVVTDRVMAQRELGDIYKAVLEHEAAKEALMAQEAAGRPSSSDATSPSDAASPHDALLSESLLGSDRAPKRERVKPAQLNLAQSNIQHNNQEQHKTGFRQSIMSVLRSPRRKNMRGVSISSPILTPMSGTFSRQEAAEMNAIPPREYAPASPPPVPMDQVPFTARRYMAPVAPPTPEMSPDPTQSIDQMLSFQAPRGRQGHARNLSQATTEVDPASATSESSSHPLVAKVPRQSVGLPASPKPGSQYSAPNSPAMPLSPGLPTSPRQNSFQSSTSTAVRQGGTLPLRAYEQDMTSPRNIHFQKTVFERANPLSPTTPFTGLSTPFTGAAVPYSPYQPFSPVVPVTPRLVTKADRKRMKKLEPKTPTLEMVKSTDEVW